MDLCQNGCLDEHICHLISGIVWNTECCYTIMGPYGYNLTTCWLDVTSLMFAPKHHVHVCEFFSESSVRLPAQIFRASPICAGHQQHAEYTGAAQERDEVQRSIVCECSQWQTNGITLNSSRAFISQNNSIHNLLRLLVSMDVILTII